MMKNCLLLIIVCILFVKFSSAQQMRFGIYLFGDSIGHMNVSREEKADGTEHYMIESFSKAKILWMTKEGYSKFDVTYKNGFLVLASHYEMENGIKKRWTNTKWNGKSYDVDSYKGKRKFSEAPQNSIMTIYFKPVKSGMRFFYEPEADFNTLTKSADEPDTYEFKSSDGTKNIYHFENGKIKSMEFKLSIATVRMVRVI